MRDEMSRDLRRADRDPVRAGGRGARGRRSLERSHAPPPRPPETSRETRKGQGQGAAEPSRRAPAATSVSGSTALGTKTVNRPEHESPTRASARGRHRPTQVVVRRPTRTLAGLGVLAPRHASGGTGLCSGIMPAALGLATWTPTLAGTTTFSDKRCAEGDTRPRAREWYSTSKLRLRLRAPASPSFRRATQAPKRPICCAHGGALGRRPDTRGRADQRRSSGRLTSHQPQLNAVSSNFKLSSGSPEIRPELGFVTWGQFLSLGLDEY
jgi:hypothetical protein